MNESETRLLAVCKQMLSWIEHLYVPQTIVEAALQVFTATPVLANVRRIIDEVERMNEKVEVADVL